MSGICSKHPGHDDNCDLCNGARVSDSPGLAGYVSCKKCGQDDILTRLVVKDKLIDSSSTKRVDDEFVYSREHSFYFALKAKKEHLSRHCRNCQYAWRENTLDT